MKATLKIYPQGGIDCLATTEQCSLIRECSNHYTAGDYRSESGFTPALDLDGNCKGATDSEGALVINNGQLVRYREIYNDER